MLLGSIFKSLSKPKAPSASVGNFSSTSSAIGPSGYVSLDAISSAPANSTFDDIQMDLGIKPKNAAYYRDLEKRKKKSQEMMDNMMASNDDDAPSSPKGPSKAELEMQKRRAEGQAARKKFEKEKGERVAALRKRYMTLLKLS